VADQPTTDRSPVPPFDESGAHHKVQAAEDAWNTRDPALVVGAYTAAERRLFGPRASAEHDHTLPLQ
jgi:nuclear transport factor 2 (NTF2) superfamily protein